MWQKKHPDFELTQNQDVFFATFHMPFAVFLHVFTLTQLRKKGA
jgi:hypothetical protein